MTVERVKFAFVALFFAVLALVFQFQLTLYAPRTRRVESAEAVTPEPEPT